MTDEANAAAIVPAQPSATPEVKQESTAPEPSYEDFDENQISEGARDNFRKYRETQKAKYTEQSNKLSEETRRRMQAEARAAEFESRQRSTEQPEDPGAEPDYKNYATIEEYRDALKAWQKKSDAFEAHVNLRKNQANQTQQAEQQKILAKGDSARTKYADFNQVISPILPIANQIPALVQFVREFDNGTDVLYHLGKNPAVLEGLSKMQPFAAGQELLRIQAALSTPAPKAISQAPEPMTPVNTGTDGSVKSILELVKKDDVTDFVARENRKALREKRGE